MFPVEIPWNQPFPKAFSQQLKNQWAKQTWLKVDVIRLPAASGEMLGHESLKKSRDCFCFQKYGYPKMDGL